MFTEEAEIKTKRILHFTCLRWGMFACVSVIGWVAYWQKNVCHRYMFKITERAEPLGIIAWLSSNAPKAEAQVWNSNSKVHVTTHS